MALTTVENVKLALNLKGNGEDSRIQLLLDMATAAINEYLGRNIVSATYSSEIYSGDGTRILRLRQRPVTAVTRVCIDNSAYYNQAAGSFDASLDLVQGASDGYAIVYDSEPGGVPQSRRGHLERIGNVWPLLSSSYFSPSWFGLPMQYAGTGKLAREVGPPRGGNILVTYTAGYTSVPADVTLAANLYVAMLRRTIKFGGDHPQAENLGQYGYSLMQARAGDRPEIGSIKGLLNRYKEIAI